MGNHWAPPREDGPRLHTTEENVKSNAIHLGVENVMAKTAERTPAAIWFEQIQTDLAHLDRSLDRVYQKIQPALTPGFHGRDDSPMAEKDVESSGLVEQLKLISRQINEHIENADIIARRIEL